MAEYIAPIQRLIEEYRRLPGVGYKTAARYAFATLALSDEAAESLAAAVLSVKRDVHKCPICFALSADPECCDICADPDRDSTVICVVEQAKDVITIEKVRHYRGLYHVLGGALSPLENITPRDLTVSELVARAGDPQVEEIIIATNPTPSGDTTATYLARVLEGCEVRVSRLAYGIPVGGDIEYADEVTLSRAMEGRRAIDN